MVPRDRSRRQVLKSGTALATLGVVGSLSGCFGLFESEDSVRDQNSPARQIPSEAGALLSVNFDSIRTDDGLISGANTVLERKHEQDDSLPASVSAALDGIEERYMLDPRAMNRTIGFVGSDIHTAFGDSPPENPFWGVLGYTDWESAAMVTSFKEVSRREVTESTYSGVTVYDNELEKMAALGDGRVVIGSEPAVRAIIDIDQGDTTGIDGQLRRAFDGTSGEYARFASSLDMRALGEQQFGSQVADALPLASIRSIAASVFRDGSERGLRVRAKLSSATDAEQLATTAESFVALARGQGVSTPLLRSYETAIENMETSSTGKKMTLRYRTSPGEFNGQAGQAIADLLAGLAPPK